MSGKSIGQETLERKNEKGFTLIELSIALIIFGLVVVPALVAYNKVITRENKKQVEGNIQVVSTAIGEFVTQYGRYPCPADPTLSTNDANHGRESATCEAAIARGNCVAGVCKTEDGDVMVGAVPFVAIGMPEYRTYDAWGKKITYVVNENLVRAGVVDPVDYIAYDNGTIFESSDINLLQQDWAANDTGTFIITNRSPRALLISHGVDGQGAYNRAGVRMVCDGAGADKENCDDNDPADMDNNFFMQGTGDYKSAFNLVQGADYFDDIMRVDISEGGTGTWRRIPGADAASLSSGNVGVGVTNPQTALHVDGNVLVEGNVHTNLVCADGSMPSFGSRECFSIDQFVTDVGDIKCPENELIVEINVKNEDTGTYEAVCSSADLSGNWSDPGNDECPADRYFAGWDAGGNIVCIE